MNKTALPVTAKNRSRTSSLRRPLEAAERTIDTAQLARQISRYAPHDGTFNLSIPGLYVSRFSRINRDCVHAIHVPALCIIAQGAKTVILGKEVYKYDSTRMLAVSVAVPVAAQVTSANASEPYLAMRLDFDPSKIAELVLKVFPHGLPVTEQRNGFCAAPLDAGIVGAAIRLMECLAQPGDVDLLAPLVIDEILIRLLRGRFGPWVAQMGFANSSVRRLTNAIAWLRANFAQPMKVEQLAELANMSVSSFHEHFKSLTSMSPLHYQKVLRLQEARRLMLSTMADASGACRKVGYLSPSQFSREYSRFFGCSPMRDIAKLRGHSEG